MDSSTCTPVTTDGSSPNSSDNSSVHFPSSNANHDDPTRANTPNIQVSRGSGTRGLFHGVEPTYVNSEVKGKRTIYTFSRTPFLVTKLTATNNCLFTSSKRLISVLLELIL